MVVWTSEVVVLDEVGLNLVGDHRWVVVEAIKENDGFAECFLAKF